MKKILKNKYNWKSIFLWSFALVFVTVIFHGINSYPFYEYFEADIERLFFIPFAMILFWGILSGIFRDNNKSYLNKGTIFKNCFLVLFIFFVSYFLIITIWFSTKGTRGTDIGVRGVQDALIGGLFLSVLFAFLFLIGYIISRIIQFLNLKIFKKIV